MLLLLGFLASFAANDAQSAKILRLHAPLGILVLALTAIRLVWWFFDKRPSEPDHQPLWQARVAHATHILLYVVVVAMGMSGIGVLVLSGAARVLFFGSTQPLPHFAYYAPMMVHIVGAFILVALMSLHIGAALFHQFVMRDRLFGRMGIGSEHQP